jgi:transcriptional regulator NrdR family protein
MAKRQSRCAFCHKQIEAQAGQRFCSPGCFHKSQVGRRRLDHAHSLERRERVCAQCGKRFLADWRNASRRYCSVACAGKRRRKLNEAQVRHIIRAAAKGKRLKDIAAEVGVTAQHVGYIVKTRRRSKKR